VLIARGGVHFRRNALREAEADFDAALRAIEGRDRDAELGQALNGRGVARAAIGREAEGIADLAAARLHLQRAGDRIAVARADANLGVIEMVRGRPAQARDYLDSALAIFEQTAAVHERMVTLSALSAVHLQRLDAQAALDAANRAARLLPRVSDHSLRLAAHLDRANALTALGRFSEARRALEDPAIAAPAPAPYEHRRAQSRVELAFHSGDAHEAVAIADAALADWTPLPADDVHDWVRLRRAQAAAMAGLPAAGPDAASPPGKASVPALLTTALERGERGGEEALRQALALAERRGAPAEIVAAAGAYVPWLIARGRLDEAAVVVGRIVPWTGRWYECALLQLQLAEALGDPAMIAEAQGHARTLAGERRLPDDRLAGRSGS
jgi:tetratricopeptide (TPR) repeat protein